MAVLKNKEVEDAVTQSIYRAGFTIDTVSVKRLTNSPFLKDVAISFTVPSTSRRFPRELQRGASHSLHFILGISSNDNRNGFYEVDPDFDLTVSPGTTNESLGIATGYGLRILDEAAKGLDASCAETVFHEKFSPLVARGITQTGLWVPTYTQHADRRFRSYRTDFSTGSDEYYLE